MHVTLSVKLRDHKGLALFIHGHLLKRTLIFVLPAVLIQILIRAFLSPVPAHCRGQSGTTWCCLADAGGTPAPSTQLRETQCRFSIFCIISFIINIISIISIISKTCKSICKCLSLFLLFPSSGGKVGVNREHLSLSLPTPYFKL